MKIEKKIEKLKSSLQKIQEEINQAELQKRTEDRAEQKLAGLKETLDLAPIRLIERRSKTGYNGVIAYCFDCDNAYQLINKLNLIDQNYDNEDDDQEKYFMITMFPQKYASVIANNEPSSCLPKMTSCKNLK